MKALTFILILILTSSCSTEKYSYPITKKVDKEDNYFGTKISDPYQWLENDSTKEVSEWIDSQYNVTKEYLKNIPFRESIYNRLEKLSSVNEYTNPLILNDYIFYTKKSGKDQTPIIYYQNGIDSEPKVFIDPSKLDGAKIRRIKLKEASKNNKFLIVSIEREGSKYTELRIIEIKTAVFLKDVIENAKFTATSWHNDGFYYSSFGTKKSTNHSRMAAHKIFYHRLGTNQDSDILFYQNKHKENKYFVGIVSDDEKNFFLYEIDKSSHKHKVYYKSLTNKNSKFSPLFLGNNNSYRILKSNRNYIYVQTDQDAPKFKFIRVDLNKPEPKNWKTLIPEKDEVLNFVYTSNTKIFTSYVKDVTSRLHQYTLDGKFEKEIKLPGLGTLSGFSINKKGTHALVNFESFSQPKSIYVYNQNDDSITPLKKTIKSKTKEPYTEKQIFYTSKDGTKIPMFIIHKKNLKLDGTNPTYLYGYGGFAIRLTPRFDPSRSILIDQGGVYAIPGVRGGGEYGKNWHILGKELNKQNSIDDFISAAEYLIQENYTNSNKLAIGGSKIGGLLVASAMTQQPDLFSVVFPKMPLLDMIRYDLINPGMFIDEFGSPKNETHFKNLFSYSPYHNLKNNFNYPATLIFSDFSNSTYNPKHSYKFISKMQRHDKNTSFIRVSNHTDKNSFKSNRNDINADRWAFMFYNMNIDYK